VRYSREGDLISRTWWPLLLVVKERGFKALRKGLEKGRVNREDTMLTLSCETRLAKDRGPFPFHVTRYQTRFAPDKLHILRTYLLCVQESSMCLPNSETSHTRLRVESLGRRKVKLGEHQISIQCNASCSEQSYLSICFC
jgi:hypothetical protein